MHVFTRRTIYPMLLGFAGVAAWWPVSSEAATPKMRLEIQPTWQEQALVSGKITGPQDLRVCRLDYLLSKLALKRQDGSWLESRDWHGFFSLEKGRQTADADGLPSEEFTALRFDMGVPPDINKSDPAQWAPGHALNPDVCGLHWGWMGGYIFMALEGHWKMPGAESGGFSYHLANDPNVAHVELPVNFRGGGPITFKLTFDVAKVLQGVSFDKDGVSTHSRDGDPLAAKLRANVEKAFRVVEVRHDLYQAVQSAPRDLKPVAGTNPYPLAITERFPKVALPADNPLTVEGVKLGEKLFHDVRLSINNTQSCASCHAAENAFSDPRRFSVGAEGQAGKRNAMALFNLAWGQGFFWDGRAKTLREQVLMPIQDKHEMNETLERVQSKITDLAPHFAQTFGSPEITADRIAKALEQYLLTLISQESRFDQAVRKVAELTEQEKHGLQLFVTEHDPKRGLFGADCFHCHGGTLFTDHQFHDNGLAQTPEDVGHMLVTKNAADRGKIKTPSLRNIAVTAPYMHDGRFNTLEEVVEHYSGPIQKRDTLDPNLAKHPAAGLQLSAADKQALIAFLKTLKDEAFLTQGKSDHLAKRP